MSRWRVTSSSFVGVRFSMKKLFISQPMNGKSDEEILRERDEAIAKAKDICDEDVEVIDSFFRDNEPDYVKHSGVYWLGRSLELLSTSDIVYFATGWDRARGCLIEHTCAVEYGIEIID